MADDLQIQIDNDISPISPLKNAYQNDFSHMKIIPITEWGDAEYNMFPESKRFKQV
jgi:hypothetical protein